MRRWSHFRFHTSWRVEAAASDVYAVLERLEHYPQWWPQVRRVTMQGPDAGCLVFRSLLPFSLRVAALADRRDPAAGVLAVALSGDLLGWARWTLVPTGPATEIIYEQATEVRKPVLRALAPLAWPAYRANHAAMMRSARRGLRKRLGDHLDQE